MKPAQLHLGIVSPAITLSRLDGQLFRSAPKEPGIYIFRGSAEQILYIGKGKNLKVRLASYRRARPGDPRKHHRLLRMTYSLEWQVCASEKDALLLENKLLRTHKPLFNVVNTRVESYYFIGILIEENRVRFRLTMNPKVQDDILHGVYKGRRRVRLSFVALLRILEAVRCQNSNFEFPPRLMRYRIPYEYTVTVKDSFIDLLKSFFDGRSRKFLEEVTTCLLEKDCFPRFYRSVIQADLSQLLEFYEMGPRRNRLLRKKHGITKKLIAQDQIDDLLVLGV